MRRLCVQSCVSVCMCIFLSVPPGIILHAAGPISLMLEGTKHTAALRDFVQKRRSTVNAKR